LYETNDKFLKNKYGKMVIKAKLAITKA